jgi:hypothetical protein
MYENAFIRIDEVGMTVSGYQRPVATVVNIGRDSNGAVLLTVKVPGSTYWRGVGLERGYAGAEFEVWRINEREKWGGYRATLLHTIPARSKELSPDVVDGYINAALQPAAQGA